MTGTDEVKKVTEETVKPAKFFLKRPGFWALVGVSFATFSMAVRWEQQYGLIIGGSVIGIAVFSFAVMLWLLRPVKKKLVHRHDTLLDALGQSTERASGQSAGQLAGQLATIPQLVGEPGVDKDHPQPAIAISTLPEPAILSDVIKTAEPVALDKVHTDYQPVAQVEEMLDNLPVGFFSTDQDGLLLYINNTLARWLGVPSVDAIGRPFSDFVDRASSEGDLYLKFFDGSPFKVVLEQSEADVENGSYTRSIVLRDVVWTDVVRLDQNAAAPKPEPATHQYAEGKKTKSETMKWLFDEAPVGIVLVDMDGRVKDCNLAFCKLSGHQRFAVQGRQFSDLVSLEDESEVSTALSKVVMGIMRSAHLEVRIPGVGGRESITSLYSSRQTDNDGEITGLVLHFIDTTEQRNLEVQFAQSQKMQAVGQLAGGVAHDFNNLLTAMIGFSDLLLDRHGPGDPDFADLQQIRQNANRATNLVRQLLAFSRQQKLAPVKLDISLALGELSNLIGRLIGEKIGLRFVNAADLAMVHVDQGQFEQVIINLCVNARDAMPGGGEIIVSTRAEALDKDMQRGHDLMPKGRYVVIDVTDTGTGIRQEDMVRIFEPFFSTKDVGAGTGLGLSTVYGIVHQTGGFIFVDSAPGKGTTFTIYLPEYKVDEDAVETDADLKQQQRVQRSSSDDGDEQDLTGVATVLLVEDEDAVRMFASRALRNKGYKVLEAENGEIGLDVINQADGPIDLILSDVIMPGMDGHTFVNLVRHELPSVKVILMSGYADDVFQDEIDRDKEIEFLGKPFSLKSLASKVKQVLESP